MFRDFNPKEDKEKNVIWKETATSGEFNNFVIATHKV